MKLNRLNNAYYILFCLALLPVLFLRDFTPANELRYLSIADEALRNHTFFTFANHGEPYADKPPLYFWFVMLGKWLLGEHRMWFLSLASLVPAIVTVRTMDRWTASELDAQNRSTARMMMLTCGLFTAMAVTLRMDMLMCMFIVLALRAFYRMATQPDVKKRTAWLFPLYLFLALFSKGPVGLLVPLGASIVFLLWKKQIGRFWTYWGWRTWGVLLAGCLLWFGAVYAEGGKTYLDNLLFHQTIDRAVNSFHHQEPFYYYFLSVWYSVAPWSLLVIGLIAAAVGRRLLTTDLQRFYCSVVLATFVILSCISSKLQIYLLPAFPFMVYLAALYLSQFKNKAWMNVLFALSTMPFVLALPAVISLSSGTDIMVKRMPFLNDWPVYAAATALTAGGIAALWTRFRLRRDLTDGIRMMAIGLLCALFLGGWMLSDLNRWTGYRAMCRKAQEMAKKKQAEHFAAWRIGRAENMDVYLGTPVEVIEEQEAERLDTRHHTVLMVRKRDLDKFADKEAWTVGRYAVVFLD